MRTLPVFLRLEGRPCVVLGNDEAALSKAEACSMAGGELTVIAPEPVPAFARWLRTSGARWCARPYEPGDLAGACLAYVSSSDGECIARVREEARREGVWLNVVDVPEACTFFSGAVVSRGDLKIAIGTGGASPGLAARLRRDLETTIGCEYAALVDILGGVRRHLERRPGVGAVIATLLDSPLLDLIRRRADPEIDRLLERIVGPGCSLAAIGVASEGIEGRA